jgi:exopolyphosphatase/guanosine-5'-triphosphate,3'-diphosphate pyrophosphatase
MQNGTLLAAIDLGSNSFRLEIGRYENNQIIRTDYLKETVRQGGGLDAEHNLSREAMQRGWDCLARFGERLAGYAPSQVRAVATQTLREARNRSLFLQQAEQLLGFPIEVISGPEEARLIYQGVARLLPQSDERRLVIDIGGRSTELILGQHYSARLAQSFRVGSVAWSMKYFADGQFTPQAFQRAEIAAQAVLDEAQLSYARAHWDVAYGASGTVGAVGEVLHALGGAPGMITRAGLDELSQRLLRAQSAERLRLEGLKPDRRAVISGGISVLRAIFDLLQISTLQVAQGALRQGALYDLLQREQPKTDVRENTVQSLMQKFAIEPAQALRVSQTACALLAQLPAVRPSASATHSSSPHVRLRWAGLLHEIGCLIAHDGAHRHGAYILEHTDAPGFSLPELDALAQLLRGQRGKPHKAGLELDRPELREPLLCLRLAILLCHARRDPQMEELRLLQTDDDSYALQLSAGWSQRWPQSRHLLNEEAQAWARSGITLSLEEAASAIV